MDTASASGRLSAVLGYPAYWTPIILVCVYGLQVVLFLPLFALLGWMEGVEGAHLRVAALQWAFATPYGPPLAVIGLAALAGPPLLLAQRHIWPGSYLAHAVDVTDLPLAGWPVRAERPSREERNRRWLGVGRRARVMSRLLLVSAALLALALLAAVIAAAVIFGAGLLRVDHLAGDSTPAACVTFCALLVTYLVLALLFAVQIATLRRVERRCGVRLRHARRAAGVLCYARRPGVNVEGARACLAAYTTRNELPLARVAALFIVAAIPLLLVFVGGGFLGLWLRLHGVS